MPYTSAQLTQYFTTLSRGAQPDAATTATINATAQQNAAGALTDAQALAALFNSTQVRATEEVAVATYAFFTGSTPSLAGIDYLVNNPGSGYNTSYYNGQGGTASNPVGGFNVANRYYNAAMNLAGNPGSVGNAAFVSQYGGLTLQQTVATAYNQIIGVSSVGQTAADAGIAAITAAIPYFQQLARERVVSGGSVDIATKAIIAAYILEEGNKADVGIYSRALDQFDTALVMGGVVTNSNLVTTYGNNGANFNPAVGPLGDGQTFNAPANAGAVITSAGVAANGVATLNIGAGPNAPIVTFTGDIAVNNGQLQIVQAGAATNTNDQLTLRFTGQAIATAPSIIAAGVESIVLSAELSAAAPSGTTLSIDIQDAALVSLTISGNESVVYSAPLYAFSDGTFSGGALRSVNAAGATAGANIDVSSAGSAAGGVTVNGSSAADTISVRSFATVTGAGGVDTFIAYAPTTAQQAAVSTILDSQAGETVGFFGLRVTAFNSVAVTAGATFQASLDSAAAGGAGRASYFTFGGDTYIVGDASAAGSFQPGTDYVIKLAGVHNLAASSLTAQGAVVLGG